MPDPLPSGEAGGTGRGTVNSLRKELRHAPPETRTVLLGLLVVLGAVLWPAPGGTPGGEDARSVAATTRTDDPGSMRLFAGVEGREVRMAAAESGEGSDGRQAPADED
jgi:hypothetical protein